MYYDLLRWYDITDIKYYVDLDFPADKRLIVSDSNKTFHVILFYWLFCICNIYLFFDIELWNSLYCILRCIDVKITE